MYVVHVINENGNSLCYFKPKGFNKSCPEVTGFQNEGVKIFLECHIFSIIAELV